MVHERHPRLAASSCVPHEEVPDTFENIIDCIACTLCYATYAASNGPKESRCPLILCFRILKGSHFLVGLLFLRLHLRLHLILQLLLLRLVSLLILLSLPIAPLVFLLPFLAVLFGPTLILRVHMS